jgi:hypothetical protein
VEEDPHHSLLWQPSAAKPVVVIIILIITMTIATVAHVIDVEAMAIITVTNSNFINKTLPSLETSLW